MRIFFFTQQAGLTGQRIKLTGFLFNGSAGFINFDMSFCFVFNRLHNKLHGVYVFHLAAAAQFIRTVRAHRNIDVAAHGAFIHIAVAGTEITQNGTKLFQKGSGLFRRTEIRFGHNFHQADPCPVQINKSFLRIKIMNGFAGILLNMHPLNADILGRSVFQINCNLSLADNRILELRNLIPLRQIGIKIVFAGKSRIFVNHRIQPQTGFNRLMNAFFI